MRQQFHLGTEAYSNNTVILTKIEPDRSEISCTNLTAHSLESCLYQTELKRIEYNKNFLHRIKL